MKKKEDIVAVIFFVLFIASIASVFLVILPYLESIQMKKFKTYIANRNYTIGTCIKGADMGKAEKHYSFVVNNKHYIDEEVNSDPVFVGESFLLLYNPNNPKESYIFRGYPIIKDSLLFTTTLATKIEDGYDAINFSYSVEGKSFERYLRHDILFPEKNRAINKNKTYKIIYNKQNPKIAYPILEDSIVPRIKF